MTFAQIKPDDIDDAKELSTKIAELVEDLDPPIAVGALIIVLAAVYKANPCPHGLRVFIDMCTLTLQNLLTESNEN